MVALKKMGWFWEFGTRKHADVVNDKGNNGCPDSNKSGNLGILAFETGRTMSKLVSLYRSLSDMEISRLKGELTKSRGIRYLNSMDQGFLMGLACAEKLEDLDKAAAVVTRLGQKCTDFGLNRFDLVYTDLKLGSVDLRKLEYGSKEIEKMVGKMEKMIAATANLYSSLEALTGMEISERKLNQWKETAAGETTAPRPKANISHFKAKLDLQRKEVQHFREVSLWSKTFDKSVDIMGRVVCYIYARICAVFSPYVPFLSSGLLTDSRGSHHANENRFRFQLPEFCLIEPILKEQLRSHSGSVQITKSKPIIVRFYSQKSKFCLDEEDDVTKRNKVFHIAGASTVGGSGLALRYANVILMAERCLHSSGSMEPEMRQCLYDMLPENLKSLVKSKLSKNMKGTKHDRLLAGGWREALKDLLGWLVPMADDTVQWHLERNPDKMKFEAKTPVVLLQTLHFSDKEKTEAAIAEVLVSLSCILRHEGHLL